MILNMYIIQTNEANEPLLERAFYGILAWPIRLCLIKYVNTVRPPIFYFHRLRHHHTAQLNLFPLTWALLSTSHTMICPSHLSIIIHVPHNDLSVVTSRHNVSHVGCHEDTGDTMCGWLPAPQNQWYHQVTGSHVAWTTNTNTKC